MTRAHDPEWREKLAERRGRANGPHIRDTPGGYDVSQEPEDKELDGKLRHVEEVLVERSEREVEEVAKKWHDFTFNTGNLLTIVIIFIGIASGCLGMYRSYTTDLNATNSNVDKVVAAVDMLRLQTQANTEAIAANNKADADRTARYAPQIEASQRLVEVTNARIENMVNSISQLRDGMADLAKVVAADHTDIAVTKMQVERNKP